jgi:hypothetical protein
MAAQVLGDAYDNGYLHMGNVFEVVYKNSQVQSPSQNDVAVGWIEQYDLYNNTLMPGVSTDDDILSAFANRECTYLVETGCMTVLWKNCTGTNGQPPFSAEQGLTELNIALGNGA